ncbi:MAG: glycosyltransferase family 4 protein [Myxococcota bacterium]
MSRDDMDKRPAVVHVITQLELGGAQRNTLHTVANLDKKRFRASLVCGPGGVLDEEARKLGIPVIFCPALARPVSPAQDLKAMEEVRNAIALHHKKTHGQLVVHTHSSKAGILGRVAAKRLGARAIVHTVHGFGFHDGQAWAVRQAYQLAERAVSGFTDAMIFVSKRDMETAEKLRLVAKDGGHLIRSGIDLSAFHPDAEARAAVRAELQIPVDAPVVVTVANFKAQKAPLVGLKAFARVAAELPQAHWVFVGEGELRAAFDAEAAQLGLTNRIHVLGWRHDVPRILAAGDVSMLSSVHEGLPRSVLEALSAGLPVAATDAGGTREVVVEGTGQVVPVGDADALGNAVLTLLRTPPAVTERATSLLKEFDIHAMVKQQENIYEWLLSA